MGNSSLGSIYGMLSQTPPVGTAFMSDNDMSDNEWKIYNGLPDVKKDEKTKDEKIIEEYLKGYEEEVNNLLK